MAEMMIDDWATETTLEKIRQILEGTMKKGPLDELLKVMEDMAKGEGVSAERARETLAAAKKTAESTKEGTETATKGKAMEANFRQRMLANGKKVHEEIQKQDIGKHLMDAGGMLAMPIKSMEDAFAKITGVFTAVGASVWNASKALISSFGKIGSGIGKAMGMIGVFGAGLLSVATGAIGYLLGAITAMGDTFFDLYDTGINFAAGLKEGATGLGSMLEVATDARLSLGDFAEYLSKNTAVAIRIGAENMAQLSKGVRDAILPMGSLGLSISEANEYLGDYLEQQRMAGALETLSQSQRTRAGAAYLEQITMLSQITGKRRKQIAEEMTQNQKSIGLQTYLNGLNEDQRQGQMAALNSIQTLMGTIDTTGGMAKDFGDSMYFGTFAATETGKNMIMAGREQEAQMIQNIQTMVKNGELSEKQAQEEMRRVIGTMATNTNAAKQTAIMGAALGEGASQMASMTQGSRNLQRGFENASMALTDTEKTIGSWDEMQNAISLTWQKFMSTLFGGKDGNAFSETMNKISKTFKDLLDPEGENSIVPALHDMADVMANHVVAALEWFKNPKNIDGIKNFLQDLPDKIRQFTAGIGEMIKSLRSFFMQKVKDKDGKDTDQWEFKSFGDIIMGAISKGLASVNWLKVVGVITAGFVAILAAKSFIGVFTSRVSGAMSGVMGKAFDKIPGMGGASKAAASVGGGGMGAKKGAMDTIAKGVGKLGKGIGQAIKGLMHGIAGGLSAFKPQVLLGAIIFGASIAAVGAGIAAAAWIMGKALPTLAEGLQAFDGLDGDNLIDVGLGMLSVAAGLAAMGAGAVVSGIGGLVGGAFSKLGEMMGAKSPLVMLEEFGNANINTKKVIANAEAMVAFSKAMAVGGVGAAAAGIGTLVGGITGALGKLFGGEDPLAQLKKFGKADIDGAKVKINAEAMKLFASAMSDAPVIKTDVVGAFFGAIVGLFGGEMKMPWDNLKAFADADVDGAKVKVNAEAMKLFGTAMSTVPEIKGKRVGGLFGAIADIFGGAVKMPWASLKEFADLDVDGAKVKTNATAMKAFASAMKDVPEVKGERVGGLFGAILDIFGGEVKMPWASLKEFADIDIDGAKVQTNATAMKAFGTAMSDVPEVKGERVGGLFGSIAGIFSGKVKMPWEQVKEFASADLGDTTKITSNANAMSAFGKAMSSMPEKIDGKRAGGLFGAVASLFSGKVTMPWDQVKEFANADMGDTTKITANANAMSAFGNAMSTMPEKIDGTRAGGLFGAVATAFAGKTVLPWDQVKTFSEADLGVTTNIEKNAKALTAFGTAMGSLPAEGISGERVGGLFGSIATAFAGKTVMPWDQVKLFAEADMGDSTKLVTNAKALGDFGTAISNMPALPEGKREGGAWGFVKGIFGGDTKMPWDKVKEFADADMGDTTKIVANANALSTFSKTMSTMDLASLEAWGDSDAMDKMSSAFGNLFGKKSPLSQIANLDKITTPLATAGTSLDSFNPKMKTLYDMLKDPAFVAGAGAVKVLTANLGSLDDAVNDWSDDELEQFKSITESLGKISGAQLKGGQQAQEGKLQAIAEKLAEIHIAISTNTTQITTEQKKTTTAVESSGPHMK